MISCAEPIQIRRTAGLGLCETWVEPEIRFRIEGVNEDIRVEENHASRVCFLSSSQPNLGSSGSASIAAETSAAER